MYKKKQGYPGELSFGYIKSILLNKRFNKAIDASLGLELCMQPHQQGLMGQVAAASSLMILNIIRDDNSLILLLPLAV